MAYRRNNPLPPKRVVLPCPSCGKGVSYLTLMKAGLPLWLKCPQCGSPLEGERRTQLIFVVASVVAGVIVLGAIAVVTYSKWIATATPDEPFYIPVSTVLPFVGVLLLLTWLWALQWTQRFGSYRVSGEHMGAPRLLRRYFLVTGSISVALLAVLTQYAGYSPAGEAVLITLALTPFLFLYPLFHTELGDRSGKTVVAVLLLWAGIVASFASAFTVYAFANVPKQGPFTQQLFLNAARLSEQDAWAQLLKLTTEETTNREAILRFLSENVVSLPEEDYSYTFNFGMDIPQVAPIPGMVDEEVEEIGALMTVGDHAGAREKYVRLWRVASNMLSGNNTLIQVLIAFGISSAIIDYYLDGNEVLLEPTRGEVKKLKDEMLTKLDSAIANAYTTEYIGARNTVVDISKFVCTSGPEPRQRPEFAGCPIWVPAWPFYDKQKTLKAQHDFYSRVVRLANTPLPSVDSDLDELTEQVERVNTLSPFRNPMGSVILRAILPQIAQFTRDKEQTKASLTAFGFILESQEAGELSEIPIDPMSGKPFIVTDKGDTIEITSSFIRDGESAVKYEFKKP